MQEYKLSYPHSKAIKILENEGAQLEETKTQEDFYIIGDAENIFKLVKVRETFKSVNLEKEGHHFELRFSKQLNLDKETAEIFSKLFEKKNPRLVRKKRSCYVLNKTRIVLDEVEDLGEFLELYPASESAKKEVYKIFEVNDNELITNSYYELIQKKA